jgi:hypothetical protein
VKDIEKLIDDLELCHHKAERHVELIVEAIGSGSTDKGAGTREPGVRHPAEETWQNAIDVLSAWLDEKPERRSSRVQLAQESLGVFRKRTTRQANRPCTGQWS